MPIESPLGVASDWLDCLRAGQRRWLASTIAHGGWILQCARASVAGGGAERAWHGAHLSRRAAQRVGVARTCFCRTAAPSATCLVRDWFSRRPLPFVRGAN